MESINISSTNAAHTNPNVAVDTDPKTFVHSMEVNNEEFESFPTLNITYRYDILINKNYGRGCGKLEKTILKELIYKFIKMAGSHKNS